MKGLKLKAKSHTATGWAAAVGVAALLAVPAGAAPDPGQRPQRPATLTAGRETALTRFLTLEKPTLFLFLKPDSTMERSFAEALRKEWTGKAGVEFIHVKTGAEPAARHFDVKETPTGLVYDRRGRLTGRSSDAGEIRETLRKAAGVPRIDWAADDDPRMAEVEKLLGRRPPGGILRTMSLAPEYLAAINDAARKAHFADGFLTRREHEVIASYVSALNKCKY